MNPVLSFYLWVSQSKSGKFLSKPLSYSKYIILVKIMNLFHLKQNHLSADFCWGCDFFYVFVNQK